MADQDWNDHDRIIKLETRVDDMHVQIESIKTYLDHKMDKSDEKNDQRFNALDQKVETSFAEVQAHVDKKLDWFHGELMDTLRTKEAEIPHWMQIRVYILLGFLGLAVSIILAMVIHV